MHDQTGAEEEEMLTAAALGSKAQVSESMELIEETPRMHDQTGAEEEEMLTAAALGSRAQVSESMELIEEEHHVVLSAAQAAALQEEQLTRPVAIAAEMPRASEGLEVEEEQGLKAAPAGAEEEMLPGSRSEATPAGEMLPGSRSEAASQLQEASKGDKGEEETSAARDTAADAATLPENGPESNGAATTEPPDSTAGPADTSSAVDDADGSSDSSFHNAAMGAAYVSPSPGDAAAASPAPQASPNPFMTQQLTTPPSILIPRTTTTPLSASQGALCPGPPSVPKLGSQLSKRSSTEPGNAEGLSMVRDNSGRVSFHRTSSTVGQSIVFVPPRGPDDLPAVITSPQALPNSDTQTFAVPCVTVHEDILEDPTAAPKKSCCVVS